MTSISRTQATGLFRSEVSRRRALQIFGIAAAAPAFASLASCSSGPSAAKATTGMGSATKGKLTFAYMGDVSQQPGFKALFALFNKKFPGITLTAQAIPSNNWATFTNAVATKIAGGSQIDVINIATEGQRLFASKGILTPLEPFIKQDQGVVDEYWSDCDANLKKWNTQYASTDGKTYYMPGGFNTMALYANKELFAKAGVSLPESQWTWDDFMSAGKQILNKTGAFLIPAAYGATSGYFIDVMPWLTTNGASTFNTDWTKATYDSPAAIESANFARSLVEQGLAPKPGGQFDAPSQMAKGKLAMFGGGRWPTINIRDLKIVDKVQIVNWPIKTGQGSPVGWDAWPITASSQNKQAAWTFIKFLISKEAGEFFATLGGTIVPARNSVANSAAFTDNAPVGSTLLSDALKYATPIPSPDRGAECQKIIEDSWLSVISGNAKAEKALPAANIKLNALLK